MKRFISILTAVIVVLSVLTVSASATTKTVKDTGGGNISAGSDGHIGSSSGPNTATVSYANDWELYAYYDSGNSIVRFGFDTTFFNEDYVYAFQSYYSHKARVKNSTHSYVTTSQVSAGSWTSKADVRHDAKPIWELIY